MDAVAVSRLAGTLADALADGKVFDNTVHTSLGPASVGAGGSGPSATEVGPVANALYAVTFQGTSTSGKRVGELCRPESTQHLQT